MLIKFWARKLDEHFEFVLNVPCGLGRHDPTLRAEGFKVFGADIDKDFIKVARGRYPAFKNNYSVADMRELPYKNRQFDVVVNLFTSFGYFDEKGNKKTLMEFARILRPGGLVIIDAHNREPTKEGIMPMVVDSVDKNVLRLVENHVDGNTWVMKSTLIKDGKKTMIKGMTKVIRVMMYSRDDLESMCREAGLKVVAVYGGYTINSLRAGDIRMLLVARK